MGSLLSACLFQYRHDFFISVIADVPVKLLAVLVQEYLSRYHSNAKFSAVLSVPSNINEDDFKLSFVIRSQLFHDRLHLLTGYAADRAQLEHDNFAFFFCSMQNIIYFGSIAAYPKSQDAYKDE